MIWSVDKAAVLLIKYSIHNLNHFAVYNIQVYAPVYQPSSEHKISYALI